MDLNNLDCFLPKYAMKFILVPDYLMNDVELKKYLC